MGGYKLGVQRGVLDAGRHQREMAEGSGGNKVGITREYDRQAVNEKLERKMGMSSINMLMDAFCGRGDLSLLFQKT